MPQAVIEALLRATERSRGPLQPGYPFGRECARLQTGNAPAQWFLKRSARLIDIGEETRLRLAVPGPAL